MHKLVNISECVGDEEWHMSDFYRFGSRVAK